MSELSVHGYKEPSIDELSDEAIYQLNFYAAKDIAKRSRIGPFICMLGMLATAPFSRIFTDEKELFIALIVLLSLGAFSRFFLLKSLESLPEEKLDQWRTAVSIAILSNAILWGIYLAAHIHLYGLNQITLIILVFTVAIEASGAMSVFIWHRLAQAYTVTIFLPSFIVLTLDGTTVGMSLMFGISIHILFVCMQVTRSYKEYWAAICNNKLLENKAIELTAATRRAEKSKEEAEEANKAKSEFLSSMSHELRTPLNAVLGFAQLLETTTEPPLSEEQLSSVKYIKDGGDHLLKLVNQVLELSTIEAGSLKVTVEEINPAEVISECLSLVQAPAEKMQVQLDVYDSANVIIKSDKTLLKQVIINLVTNAIKYNKKGGFVTINSTVVNDDQLRVSVTDTGHGIAKEQQDQVFSSFTRLGKERSSIEGTGIGLTITKRIIEALDGQIGFESTEGESSTFWIELPIVK